MKTSIAIAAIVLLGTTAAAFANDARELHKLYGDRLVEDGSTAIMTLGDFAKSKPIAVLEKRGPMRRIAVSFLDVRAEYRPPLSSMISPLRVFAGKDVREAISRHPVARYEGMIDCHNGKVDWRSMTFADGTTGEAAIFTPLEARFASTILLTKINGDDLTTLCALPVS
jgi:hypothetical protein